MSAETEVERVLARVRKLMTLANDKAASAGERDNAIRMAHNTLAKHNLTMSEAEAGGKKPEEERGAQPLAGRNHPWTRTVVHGLAKLFFCEYFYVSLPGSKVIHYFIGKQSNAITAKEMSTFVIKSIDTEAQRYANQTGGGGTAWRSFCKGAAVQVYWRCDAIRKEAEKQKAEAAAAAQAAAPASTSTAMVLSSVYAQEEAANKAFIENMGGEPPKVKPDRQKKGDPDAKRAGAVYGDTISLQTQIGSAAAPKPKPESAALPAPKCVAEVKAGDVFSFCNDMRLPVEVYEAIADAGPADRLGYVKVPIADRVLPLQALGTDTIKLIERRL